MFLGMKVAVHDTEIFLDSVAELEQKGVKINGFEFQVLPQDKPGEVKNAIDIIKNRMSPSFAGLHPPFPSHADDSFVSWNSVAADMKLDYTVLHAAVPEWDFLKIRPAVHKCLAQAKGDVFLENIPIDRPYGIGANLVEAALLHDKQLFDIFHTLKDHYEGGRLSIDPLKQLELVIDNIRAVHVADYKKSAVVPSNGGSKMFQDIMKQLSKRMDVYFIAESENGHLNSYAGHKATCTEIWSLWEKFRFL